MEKKDAYSQLLPHFQQPGQAYFVTFCLWNTVSPDALAKYTEKLRELRWKIDNRKKHQQYDQLLKELENDYSRTRRHYFNAFDKLMAQNTDRSIDLNRVDLSVHIIEGLTFWADTHIENYAWCIMPNHVHWVFRKREKDLDGKPVYLSDILEPVKNSTAREINRVLEREGPLWEKESFDIAVKDQRRLGNAIEYTLNNPVAAKLVNHRNEWPGSWAICGL